MPRARVAILGLGRMGSTIDQEVVDYPPVTLPYSIAGACRASQRVELVAGCDLLPEKRQAFGEKWGVTALYEDFAEMISAASPDIVAICTRGENHAELTVAVAGMGVKGIYCEKAIACSLTEADAALEAVSSRGIAFATGVLRRYDNRYAQVREMIADGAIGKPTAAVHYASTNLLHGHSHSVDTLLYLLGDPQVAAIRGELRPRGLVVEDRIDQDPSAVYQFETDSGLSCWSVPAGGWEFEVLGTEGILRTTDNGANGFYRRKQQVTGRYAPFLPTDLPPVAPASPTLTIIDELAGAVLDGAPLREGIERAHHVTEACLAVADSHRHGGSWLTLPATRPGVYVYHV